MRSTIVRSWKTTYGQCWGKNAALSAEPIQYLVWQCSSVYSTNSGVYPLELESTLPPPVFLETKSLWHSPYPQDKRTTMWHSLPYRSRNFAECRSPHSKDQQKRRCQRHPAASITLATGDRESYLLLWRTIKAPPLYFFCILCTYVIFTVKVPSYILV